MLDQARDSTGVDAWQHAAALDPWDSRPRRRISVALAQRGDLDGAIAALDASIAAGLRDPAHYAPDHLNLAFLLEQRGATAAAIEHLRAAARADPAYVRARAPGLAGVGSEAFQAALRSILAEP
jgi:tetratricopeptide (TPR) repeat protein